jgi:hypothetical protein
LIRAEDILGLCTRFGCLPSALYDEDEELLQLLAIERLSRRPDDFGEEVA